MLAVVLAPACPQPWPLLRGRHPTVDGAPAGPGQLYLGVGAGLEIEPPGRLGRPPHPYITQIVQPVIHDESSVVETGCDDQWEFEFSLDLLLDGLGRLRDAAPH